MIKIYWSFLLLCLLTIPALAQVTSNFNLDSEGWTCSDNGMSTNLTVNYNATGGNPGGYVSAATTSSQPFFWTSPSQFGGNVAYLSYGQNLTFDIQLNHVGTVHGASTLGDVQIRIPSGQVLSLNLPTFPAQAPAWSTFSVRLDETAGWRVGHTGGPLATQAEMLQYLSGVHSFRFSIKYTSSSTVGGAIDNVVLNQRTISPAPTISSFTPTSGKPGTSMIINGNGFDPVAANNAVFFSGIAGVITNATATSLTVTIPTGAQYGSFAVVNKITGQTKSSAQPFIPTFDGGGRIIPASIDPKFDIPLSDNYGGLNIADMDGDGWNDLLVANRSGNSLSLHRNLGTGGDLSAASFAPPVVIPGVGNQLYVYMKDLDNDGKLDIVSNYSTGFVMSFATLRNTSTPGNLSFETAELWPGLVYSGFLSEPFDVDGDGFIDLIAQHGNGSVAPDFWIAQNLSTPGNILFASSISYFGNTLDAGAGVSHGDLDGDGKQDLVIKSGFGGSFSIAQNNSVPGLISFGTPQTFSVSSSGNVVISDLNLDGKKDLAWKNGFSNDDVHIRINTNSGAPLAIGDFATEIIIDSEISSYGKLSLGDINGDGRVDIIATDNADVGIFENVFSSGVFDANAFVPGYRIQGNGISTYPEEGQAADLNGDGKPDIVVGITNVSPNRLSIYENTNIHTPVISLNTVSPLQGPVGSTVTITGNYFSTTLSENKVHFGDVNATVLTATETELTVTVPSGASYAPVRVTRDQFTASYHLPFAPTFSPGVTFDNTHFSPPIEFTLTAADYDIDAADLNEDGKPDVIAEGNSNRTYLFRNTHTTGAISLSSLLPDDSITTTPTQNARLIDLNGDNKPDFVATSGVFRNISVGSEINFEAQTNMGGTLTIHAADFNHDGKTDYVGSDGTTNINVFENRMRQGTGPFVSGGNYNSLSANINFAKPGAGGGAVAVDFDNDGFADIACGNGATDNITVWRNNGTYRLGATSFTSVGNIATDDNPGRLYTGDLDVDGKMDIVLYYGTGTSATLITIFHNQSTPGNITFNRVDLTNPSNTTLAHIEDLDGDGKPEIITTSETGNRFSIFKNVHTAGPLTSASFAAPFSTTVTAPRGLTTADLNLDGKPEIIITRAAGFLVVFENLIGNPTITSFNPSSGPIGTTVTITGANFSSTPTNNIVTFNGIAAVVTASTANSITTTVPAGATTGVISVTVSGAIGVSATAFTVTSPVLTPGLVWARAHIGSTDTFSEDVTTDAAGNVYTTGSFDQTTDFDPGPGVLNLTSAGNADIYVSKLNANGDLAWAFSLGSITSDAGTGIATDATGNVYVSGSFSGTVDFDPGPGTTNLTGGGKFLCKFDTNGNLISAFALPGTLSFDIPLAVDAADNLYLAGGFSGTADFDPGIGTFNMTSAGSTDIFILKLSSTGTFIWGRRMGSTLLDRATALELDATGNAHLTGSFNGTVDFDPGAGTANLTSAGATDAFIQKLDNAGNYLWARRVGGTSALDTGNGIALDSDDNVLITGRFDGTVDFDPGAAVNNLTSVGGGDAFVLKLTSAGIFDWAKSMGGTFGEEGRDIVCDAFDNVYTTGDLRSNTADFDPGPGTFNLSRTGSWEVYVSGLDAAGNFMWAIASQGAAGSSVYQPELSLDAAGNIILIGVIEDAPADLDPGICVTNISTNGVTAFIAKLRAGTISSCGPTITINPQPVSTIACVGSSANFTTGATGTTNILYQWQYSIDGTSFANIANNVNYSGVTTSTLSVNVTGLVVSGFYRCKVDGDLAATVFTSNATLTVNNLPAAPTVTPGSGCAPTTVTLNASGGSAGQYRWYTVATGGTVITGEVNSSYITPILTATTSYFVAIDNGSCESLRTPVIATINVPPTVPTITSNIPTVGNALTICSTTALTLSAPNGFASYSWSTGATTSQINVSTSGTYSVTVTDGSGCVSPASDAIIITVVSVPCNNQAPVIANSTTSTIIGGQATINLLDLISDVDNNLVLSSLTIVQQPTSGASAVITNGILEIDYKGINFSGRDQVTIQVCDVFGECVQQILEIDVIGDIEIYNGISPNSDDQNEIFLIRYVDLLPDTQNNKVTIYNRWGSKVFEVSNYNNTTNVFRGLNNSGGELPSGTYFYKIEFSSGRKSENGYLTLKK